MAKTDITAINAKTISVAGVPIADSAAPFGQWTTFDQLDADTVLALNGTVIQGVMPAGAIFSNFDNINVLSGVGLGDVVKYGSVSTVATNAATGPIDRAGIVPTSPTLGTVTLSGSIQIGTATTGTLLGATALSTLVSNIPGITFNSNARTYAGTPTGSAQTITNGIVETLAGAVGSPKSSPVTVAAAAVVAPAALTAPTFTGTAQDGQTLTGARGTYTNSPTSYTSQWQSSANGGTSWTNIAGATSLNYTPVTADVGKTVRLTEIATNAGGSSASNASAASGTVAAAASSVPGVPTLTNRSNFVSGTNPPDWDTALPAGTIGYDPVSGTGDQIRAQWRLDGGAWTNEPFQPLDEELVTGVISWPTLANTIAGGVFEVQESVGRDVGLSSEVISAWSNTWTDTLPKAASYVHKLSQAIDWGYSADTKSFDPVTVSPGDKVLVFFDANFGGGSFTSINSGAMTLTLIGATTATSANGRVFAYWGVVPAGMNSLTLTVTPTGAHCITAHIGVLNSTAAGGPVAANFEKRTLGGDEFIDVDLGLAAPTNGLLTVLVGNEGGQNMTFAGATLVATAKDPADWRSSLGIQTIPGDVTITGPGYQVIYIASVKWSAA